ncbi:hypothetical protein TgHK011_006305 [Trichoderma gracile]|nr:hypothetical protein TgHK011_006305 [Trichoderma gracile]
MPRGSSSRLEEPVQKDRVFAAGDRVEQARLARARAQVALALAEEEVRRAVWRWNAEQVALAALKKGLGAWGLH